MVAMVETGALCNPRKAKLRTAERERNQTFNCLSLFRMKSLDIECSGKNDVFTEGEFQFSRWMVPMVHGKRSPKVLMARTQMTDIVHVEKGSNGGWEMTETNEARMHKKLLYCIVMVVNGIRENDCTDNR